MTALLVRTHPTPPVTSGDDLVPWYAGGVWFLERKVGAVSTLYWSRDRSNWALWDDFSVWSDNSAVLSVLSAGGRWFVKRTTVGKWSKTTNFDTWGGWVTPTGWSEQVYSIAAASDNLTYIAVAATQTGGASDLEYAVSTDGAGTWTKKDMTVAPGAIAQSVAYANGLFWMDYTNGTTRTLNSTATPGTVGSWAARYAPFTGATPISLYNDGGNLIVFNDGTAHGSVYNATTDTLVAIGAAAPGTALNRFDQGWGGSVVSFVDDGSTWSFDNLQQLHDGGWSTYDTGVAAGFEADAWAWAHGSDGTLVVSGPGGVFTLDFFAAPHGFTSPIGDDSATTTTTVTVQVDQLCTDTTFAADEVEVSSYPLTIETAAADAAVTAASTAATLTLTEAAVATDAAFDIVTLVVSEDATATDELTLGPWGQDVTESAVADSLLTLVAAVTLTVSEDATATDAATVASGPIVNEDATATDVLSVVVAATVIEDAVADNDLFTSSTGNDSDTVTEEALADETVTLQVHATSVVTESVVATDFSFFKNGELVAWVLNTENTAVSWYSNYEFVDMVQVGSQVIGVGPSGICVVGGDLDGTDAIDAGVTYGLQDFGAEQRKQVKRVWISYTADGALEAAMRVAEQAQAYTYTIAANDSNLPKNGGFIPGRGLISRWWAMAINNVDGSDFEVSTITVDAVPSARRSGP